MTRQGNLYQWMAATITSMSLLCTTQSVGETAGATTPQRGATEPQRDMIAVLPAAGPHPSLGNEAGIFDRLVGTWDCDYAFYEADGSVRHSTGELRFGWIIDGWALQDIWIGYPKGPSDERTIGTSVRFFDTTSKMWRVVFVAPAFHILTVLQGGAEADRIVLRGQDSDGTALRWSFNDIKAASFVWRGEKSRDGGKTWRLEEEHHMTRRLAGAASSETRQWFQTTEQALMNSLALGDKRVWDRIMDPLCVVTTEEGEVITKEPFLEGLRPLPEGLEGAIAVREMTVQEFPTFALVRYLADESESVFGQRLSVQYRVTNAYRRDGPGWKMVASHLSVVTKDPTAQDVSRVGWPALVGEYHLRPNGWTFTVELRDGELYGGRDPTKLRRLIPLAPNVFVVSGSLGEWVFNVENGKPARLVNLRKFAVLVWTR